MDEPKNVTNPVTEIKEPKKTKTISWGPLTAVVVTIIIYFVSQFAAGLIIIIYPAIRHWNGQQINDWLNSSVVAQFINIALVEGIVILMLQMFLQKRKASFATIGWNRRLRITDIVYAFAGFAVYFVLLDFIAFRLLKIFYHGINFEQKQDIGFTNVHGAMPLLLVFISLVILPPLVEETLVRGFLYSGLRTKLPKLLAAMITSIIFATAHLQIGSGNPLLWAAAVDTFVLSLVLVYLREKTDSLWASTTLHMLKNGLAYAALFIVPIVHLR